MGLKERYFINLHKMCTPFVILTLMKYYNNYTVGPLIYFGLHTGYCICWLLKEMIYPDESFENGISPPMFVLAFITVAGYWIAPYMLISSGVVPSTLTILFSIPACLVGFFFHFGSDAQKYFVLKTNKELIMDGFFASTRNPNYFGEVMMYLGWGVLTESLVPLGILLGFATLLFYPRMRRKDISMSRYTGFINYKKKSNLFFPKIF
jgi:Putative protein-S-isoprenylcysteine methyltransferase